MGLSALFNQAGFLPHGYCLSWSPSLLWTMVVADAVIVLAYYSIPLALLHFLRRSRGLQFHWMFVLFSVFIFACGTTHLVAILNIWKPAYWLDALIKAGTAVVSMATAIFLWPLVPVAARFIGDKQRSSEQLAELNQRLSESVGLLERRSAELVRLNRLGDQLQTCRDAEEFARELVAAVTDLQLASSGALLLPQPSGRRLEPVAVFGGLDSAALAELPPLPRHAPRGHEAGGAECPLCAGAAGDHVCALLVAGEEALGVLHLRGIPVQAASHELTLIETLAERGALALANLRLRENLVAKSVRDPLTGLYNRRFLDEALPTEERRARRMDGGFAVVIFDLDHFKALNDRHGHDAGDAALRSFARLLQGSVRSGDIACRLGGEEFLLLLPAASVDDAAQRAERVRWSLAHQTLEHCGEVLGVVTVSAGVAAFPLHGDDAAGVLRAADRALYRAKQSGRDRVAVAWEAAVTATAAAGTR